MANITIIALSDFEKVLQGKKINYEVTGTVREETYNLSINIKEDLKKNRYALLGIVLMLPGTVKDSIELYHSLVTVKK